MRAIPTLVLLCLLTQPVARAQDGGPILTDETTGERYRTVRPEDPMRRGRWPVPAWAAIAGGAAIGVTTLVVLAVRTRRKRSAKP